MRVVVIIAQKDFRDEELFDTRLTLRQFGVEVKIACQEEVKAFGKLGGQVDPDLTIAEIEVVKFNGLVLVGGPGAFDFIDNQQIHDLIRQFFYSGKVVSAIGVAPVILAHAGILQNREATVNESGLEYFQSAGVNYVERDIVVTGKIITGSGPAVASIFGQTIAKNLS